jgi:hypothetical protein
MTGRIRLIATVAAILASMPGSSVLADPPGAGTISVEVKTADGAFDSSTAAFVNAISDALAAKGLTTLDDPGHAAFVAEATLSRAEVGTRTTRARPGSYAARTTGSAGVGAGFAVALPAGQTRLVPLQRVRLEMRIRKRGEEGVLWSGVALTVRAAGTPKGADDVVASDLSGAVLRSYPATSEGVATVP